MKKIISIIIALLLVLTFLPKQEVSAASFTDVKSTQGFYGEIMFLLEKEVIKSGTSFINKG